MISVAPISSLPISATKPAAAGGATYTIDATATLGAIQSAATLDTVTLFQIDATASLGAIQSASTVSTTVPVYTVDASATLGALQSASTVSTTIPIYAVDGTATLGAIQSGATVATTTTVYAIDATATLGAVQSAATANFIELRTIAIAASLPAIQSMAAMDDTILMDTWIRTTSDAVVDFL